MTAGAILLWIVLPYVALAIFVAGHVWRYRHDQFGWTSRSTELLERRLLGWGSPMFHYGALAAIAGHALGILIPPSVTNAIGIPEHTYHLLAAIAGAIAGGICIIGFLLLVYRRATVRRVAMTTSRTDIAVYALLALAIGLGEAETLGVQAFGATYDYRDTVGVWFRDLLTFRPTTAPITNARLIFQIHAISAWPLYMLWPFSRLVHAWSIPLQYLGRPYILYRRRYPPAPVR